MLFAQYLPSALSKVATRHLREHVFVLIGDYFSSASYDDVCPLLSLVGVVFGPSLGECILYLQFFLLFNGRVDSRLVTIAQSSDTSCSCSSVGLPLDGVVGFKDVSSRLGVEALTQISVLMKLL